MRFDPDEYRYNQPNLIGEMTSVFLPDQSSQNMLKSWIPSNWIAENNYIINPQREFAWNISGYTYLMREYICRFYVSINAEWDGNVEWLDNAETGPIGGSRLYHDAEVWVKFDLTPTWYIDGQNRAYFTIAQVRPAADAIYGGLTLSGEQGTIRTKDGGVSVTPESIQTPLFIFDAPFGGGSYVKKEPYEYQGRQLNPALFKDEAYIRLNLNNFGVSSDIIAGIPPWSIHGDVVTWKFDVVVFLIGEWTVQDIQDDPDRYGRFQREDSPTDWLEWAYQNLWWIIPVAIIVLIIFVAPWLLVALLSVLRG